MVTAAEVRANDIAEFIGGELSGDGTVLISGVAGLGEAEPGQIAFVESPKYREALKKTRASCVVAPFKAPETAIPVITCKNPSLAMTRIIYRFFPPADDHPRGQGQGVVKGDNVSLGRNVVLGSNTVLGDNVVIGDNTVIYPLVYIGANTVIGKDCIIYPHVSLREGVTVGSRVIIHSNSAIGNDGFGYAKDGEHYVKIPQLGTVEIQDEVEIGAGVTIDRARFGKTLIGKGTKIDNLVQIAHNVVTGEHCVIVAQVGISGSVCLGKSVILGGQVGLADHIEVGDNVMVAAKGGITKSVPPRTIMSGIPARPHNITKRIVGHIDNLPKLVERVQRLEQMLNTKKTGTEESGES